MDHKTKTEKTNQNTQREKETEREDGMDRGVEMGRILKRPVDIYPFVGLIISERVSLRGHSVVRLTTSCHCRPWISLGHWKPLARGPTAPKGWFRRTRNPKQST